MNTFGLKTIFPLVRFLRADGRVKAEGKRTLREYKGQLCVVRRGRLLPVSAAEGGNVCMVRLSDAPLAVIGEEGAQAIAPAITLAKLGVAGPTRPKAAKAEDKPAKASKRTAKRSATPASDAAAPADLGMFAEIVKLLRAAGLAINEENVARARAILAG